MSATGHRVSTTSRLLKFATGSTNVPLGGFAALNPPFTVTCRLDLSAEHLATASTCVNMVLLPAYPSLARTRQALHKALEQAGL
eukprot:SAG31_NODE_3199_length_4564_cov_18.467861_4_plen_84_part_00